MTTAVRVAVAAVEAELAADALWQAVAAAIEERPGALVAATADGADPAPLLAAVAGRWSAEAVPVDLDGALDAWRPHARAVSVGDRLVVRPPWVEPVEGGASGGPGAPGAPDAPGAPPPGAAAAGADADAADHTVDVVIDPGRAFGHGAHPTTRLVLDALVDLVRGGERVLDVGCGSGVLAVAALALGAGSAVGVDIDPAALVATRANAARNGVADRLVVTDDVGRLDEPPVAGGGRHAGGAIAGACDLVMANMLASQLVAVAPVVARAVAPGGAVVLSGLLTGQRDAVLDAYRPSGLRAVGERVEEGWLALTLRVG